MATSSDDRPRTYRGSVTAAIISMQEAGATVRQIANELEVTTQHVYRTLARWGKQANPPQEMP